MADESIATGRRGSRGGRVFGAVIGVLLLPAALGMLAWNEGRGSNRDRALTEGAGAVREAPVEAPDPSLEGRLVHVSGPLRVPGILADPDLAGVRAPPGTVQLRRLVQTYQWQERSSRGDRSYAQVWSDQIIDSTAFHQPGGPPNPPPRFRAIQVVAADASLGPYRLTEPLLRELGGGEPFPPAADAARDGPGIHPWGSGLYVGANPDAPAVGDQRLTWEVVRVSSASVIARLRGSGFVPYRAASGDTVHEIVPGVLSAEEMIASAKETNAANTWILRAMGAGLLFLGLFLVLRTREASAIPGGDPVLAAGVLTAVAVPAAIAAAWLAAGDMVAAGLLVACPILAWMLIRRLRPMA